MEPRPPAGASGSSPRAFLHWGWTLSLTGLLLAGAAAVVLHSPWMKLREVEIVGAAEADVAGRLARAGIGPGAFMIWLRPGEIEAAVEEDPWVREVRVERIFPNRVVVEVLERNPAVWVGEGEAWMLVSRDGVVLVAADAPGEGLLRARLPYEEQAPGRRPSEPEWQELADLGAALSPSLAGECWVMSQAGELWLEARGYRARLGQAVDLADKGRVFEGLLGSSLPAGAVIDLIAPTRPAVTLPDGTAAADDEAVVEGEDGG